MLEDMLYEDHLRVLYTALKECPAMTDAICLFKTWLYQRSFKVNNIFGRNLLLFLKMLNYLLFGSILILLGANLNFLTF